MSPLGMGWGWYWSLGKNPRQGLLHSAKDSPSETSLGGQWVGHNDMSLVGTSLRDDKICRSFGDWSLSNSFCEVCNDLFLVPTYSKAWDHVTEANTSPQLTAQLRGGNSCAGTLLTVQPMLSHISSPGQQKWLTKAWHSLYCQYIPLDNGYSRSQT